MSQAEIQEINKTHLKQRKAQREDRLGAEKENNYKATLNCSYHGASVSINCKQCVNNLRERLNVKSNSQ